MSETERGHEVTIIVNTRKHTWERKKISYEQVIELAYSGQPVTDQESVTVKYSRGADGHGSGTLTAGHDVAVKNKMVFDVVRTSRS